MRCWVHTRDLGWRSSSSPRYGQAKELWDGGAGSQYEEGCPWPGAWARWDNRGCSATLRGEDKVGKPLGSCYKLKTLIPPPSRPCRAKPPNPHSLLPKKPQTTGWAATTTTTFYHPDGRAGAAGTCSGSPGGTRPRRSGRQLIPWKAPSPGCANPIRNSISRLPVAKGSAAPSTRGRGGLVQALSRDRSQFEFLPKDGQQFT